MLTSLGQLVFLVSLHFKWEETWIFHEWCRCSILSEICFCLYSLFLNICNTVMMTSCHVEMSAVLFLYVCVQASKEIIKLKKSLFMLMFLPQLLFPRGPRHPVLRPAAFIIEMVGLRNTPPPPLPLCLPSQAQPRSPFSPLVIHLASSFHCRDKGTPVHCG